MVNINLISFNFNHFMKLAKQKTSKHTTVMVSYELNMGCNGNIMPLNIFQKNFSYMTEDRLAAAKDITILRTYNSTNITHFGDVVW